MWSVGVVCGNVPFKINPKIESLPRDAEQQLRQELNCPFPPFTVSTMDCFEAPRMGLNLIFIKVSAAPTGALGPWKVEEP